MAVTVDPSATTMEVRRAPFRNSSTGIVSSSVAPVDRVPGAQALRADDHRAQLEDVEVDAVLAHAGLPVEDGTAVPELRRERRESDDRARQRETDSGDRHVGRAVHRVPLALSHVCGVPERR